jgi:SPX domain protein involved in polyphosphate accumulation
MKFGRRLDAGLKEPAWEGSYIHYSNFKSIVSELSHPSQLEKSRPPCDLLTLLCDGLQKDALQADGTS